MANLLQTATNWEDGANASPPGEWNGSAYAFTKVDTLTLIATAQAGDTLIGTFAGTEQNEGHQIAIKVNGVDAIDWAGFSIESFPSSINITLAAGDTVQIVTSTDACGYAPAFTLTPPAKIFACDGPILEIWPPPNNTYSLRIRGYPSIKPFGYPVAPATTADDTAMTACDARLVLLMALANAKANYEHPDANVYANEMTSLLGKLRAKRHGNHRYIPDGGDGTHRDGDRELRLIPEPVWVK